MSEKKSITWLLALRETGARGLLSQALNGPKIFLRNAKLFSAAILPHLTVLIRQRSEKGGGTVENRSRHSSSCTYIRETFGRRSLLVACTYACMYARVLALFFKTVVKRRLRSSLARSMRIRAVRIESQSTETRNFPPAARAATERRSAKYGHVATLESQWLTL